MACRVILTNLPEPSDDAGEYEYFVTEDEGSLPEGYRFSKYSLEGIQRTDYAPDSYTIENGSTASVKMPETGGPGTAGITAFGFCLAVFAVGIWCEKNRKGQKK